MSEPKNHHYVSQCHIKNFFNVADKRIYLYDKTRDNFYDSKSTKNIFSEKFANSRLTDGRVDNVTLESELKVNFEDHFPRITELIEDFEQNISTKNFETIIALYRLTLYGLIGEIRNPKYKRKTDDTFKSVFNELLFNADDSLKTNYEIFISELNKTKYSNTVGYFDLAIKQLESMGDLVFKIFIIKSKDLFLLPDTSSIYFRGKINEYFNPDIREKAMIGIPLTNKLFIHAESTKLQASENQVIKIKGDDNKIVRDINKNIFNQAYNTVATSDRKQLVKIIADIKGSA